MLRKSKGLWELRGETCNQTKVGGQGRAVSFET